MRKFLAFEVKIPVSMRSFMLNALVTFLAKLSLFGEIFEDIWQEISLCVISGLGTLEPIGREILANLPVYLWTIYNFSRTLPEGYKWGDTSSVSSLATLLPKWQYETLLVKFFYWKQQNCIVAVKVSVAYSRHGEASCLHASYARWFKNLNN